MDIVFFDIDGTLAKGTEVPLSAQLALRKLRNNGDLIFICTGRPYTYAYANFFRYANGFVTNNGRYAQMGCCEVMVHEPLSLSFIEEVKRRLYGMPVSMTLFGIREAYFIGDHASYEKDKARYKPGYLKEGYRDEEVFSFDLSYDSIDRFDSLREVLSDVCILNPHGMHPSCDVTIRGFDKGDAIIRVAKHLGVPVINTYAFGDGMNDICMAEKAGHFIAMGNATQKLKDVSEYITSSIDEDGVKKGLEHYGLI